MFSVMQSKPGAKGQYRKTSERHCNPSRASTEDSQNRDQEMRIKGLSGNLAHPSRHSIWTLIDSKGL